MKAHRFGNRRSSQNIYDMGVIANFVDFFEADTFFWWWPKVRRPIYDGCEFIKIPAATRQDIQKLSEVERQALRTGCEYRSFD